MAKTVKKSKSKPTKLKPSITPGTVLILLAGRYRGKRVVFLKQLASGLLLVTGPHRVNGVPLRRVNQAYVIATSTKVNVKGIKLDSLSDSSFPGKKTDKSEVADTAKAVSAGRKKAQTEVDSAILTALKAEPVLGKYLKARFSLTSGMKPHEMVF
jgi:large subunit ribosomal protein L6e